MGLLKTSKKELEWAKDKNLPSYLIVFVAIAYIAIKQIAIPTWQSFIDIVNFGIHELGHPTFSLFGDFMHALGGTIFEIGVPLLAVFVLYEQRMYFASAAASVWLTTAFYSASVYSSDAQALTLPLASISGEVDSSAHDWHYMLERLGWLEHDQLIGDVFAFLGIIAALYGLYRGVSLLNLIFSQNHNKEDDEQENIKTS